MLTDWLDYKELTPNTFTTFKVINVVEKTAPNDPIYNSIAESILAAYRNLDFLKLHYQTEPKEMLVEYLKNNVFPTDVHQIGKNVRQGDFGEILTSLIVSHYQGLEVPLRKLQWKFNKSTSVFCTDMLAHNPGSPISQLYYYEIKSRLHIEHEKVKDTLAYITVIAHNSLQKDENVPNEGIADFLSRKFYEEGDNDKSLLYHDIVKNPSNYTKNYELFFILEKSAYLSVILDDLEKLPPTLKPLSVTVVLLDNLRQITETVYAAASTQAVKLIHGEE
jgi:hypothetical protein